LKRCFFCGEPGHDSRACTEKSKICPHCKCKGHTPVTCPTRASQELVSFANTHCLRCGALGHANCGGPPLAVARPLAQMQNAPPPPAGGMSKSRPSGPPQGMFGMGTQPPPPPPQGMFDPSMSFSLLLPPPTPGSPPPSPAWGSPGDNLDLVEPSLWAGSESKASSLYGVEAKFAPMMPVAQRKAMNLPRPMNLPQPQFNGGGATAVKSPGKAGMGNGFQDPGNRSKSGSLGGYMPISRDVSMSGKPISQVPPGKAHGKGGPVKGKAPISKVPGKAPITKMQGSAVNQPATLLKASAKRPSNGAAPSPKKAKSQGKGW